MARCGCTMPKPYFEVTPWREKIKMSGCGGDDGTELRAANTSTAKGAPRYISSTYGVLAVRACFSGKARGGGGGGLQMGKISTRTNAARPDNTPEPQDLIALKTVHLGSESGWGWPWGRRRHDEYSSRPL